MTSLGIALIGYPIMLIAFLLMVIYCDVRRRRAAERQAELEERILVDRYGYQPWKDSSRLFASNEASSSNVSAESARDEYEAELEARYQAEIEHSEQYREWQAGGPAPSGRLSRF